MYHFWKFTFTIVWHFNTLLPVWSRDSQTTLTLQQDYDSLFAAVNIDW